MISQHDIQATLEATFSQIQQERMEGVPVINDRLSVKAIGFHEWNNNQLGVLVTPWFMNLMLFPQSPINDDKDPTEANNVGSTQYHNFPSGTYDFIAGYEEAIGYYQSCSLFSPMFEFEDQSAAELTAKEVLAALMNEDNIDFSSQSQDQEIEQIWKGKKPAPVITDGFCQDSKQAIEEAKQQAKPKKLLSEHIKEHMDEPTSRRDFLHGKIFRSDKSL